jgi:site-specific DNA-methyltransferase (adenine-specific)
MALTKQIILGDSLEELGKLSDKISTMIYIDPPFNTGKVMKRDRIKTTAAGDDEGDRIGFGNKSYNSARVSSSSYNDQFDDYQGFLMPRIEASLHCLTDNGSIFVHLDYREVHYIKVALDKLIGRDHFINEIIWSYDYGARSKKKWSNKHDTILWYAMNPKDYIFNFDAMERVPYMAPGLVGKEKAAKGKTLTDVIWQTICPTNGPERTGYATQKPVKLIEKLIKVHTNKDDSVLDYFCGSGTTGHAAIKHGRGYILIDESKDAIDITTKRLANM